MDWESLLYTMVDIFCLYAGITQKLVMRFAVSAEKLTDRMNAQLAVKRLLHAILIKGRLPIDYLDENYTHWYTTYRLVGHVPLHRWLLPLAKAPCRRGTDPGATNCFTTIQHN